MTCKTCHKTIGYACPGDGSCQPAANPLAELQAAVREHLATLPRCTYVNRGRCPDRASHVADDDPACFSCPGHSSEKFDLPLDWHDTAEALARLVGEGER